MKPDHKRCTQCGGVRPIGSFAFRSLADNLRHSECIHCSRERGKRFRQMNPERILIGQLKEHRKRIRTLQIQIVHRAGSLQPWEELSAISEGGTYLWEQLRVALNRDIELVGRLHALREDVGAAA